MLELPLRSLYYSDFFQGAGHVVKRTFTFLLSGYSSGFSVCDVFFLGYLVLNIDIAYSIIFYFLLLLVQ